MAIPLVSLITVVRNDADGLRRTLQSTAAQTFRNFQLVVVDGASVDGTTELVRMAHGVDVWLSEPDEGIYHAMNKGIARAAGEWLLFMNAGDEFDGPDALAAAVACITPDAEAIYSDWRYREDKQLARADLQRLNVRHQAVMYRKTLHETYGQYLVGPGVTISDYLFFLSISHRPWRYCATPMACCDRVGASGRSAHFHQRLAAEFIFGRRSRVATVLMLLAHPLYRLLKTRVLRRP